MSKLTNVLAGPLTRFETSASDKPLTFCCQLPELHRQALNLRIVQGFLL